MSLIQLDSLSPNLQLDTKTTFLAWIVIEIWDFEMYGGHLCCRHLGFVNK